MSTEALKAFVFNESVPIMDSSPLPGGVPGGGMIVPPALGGAAASLFMTGGRNRVPGAAMMRSVVAPDTGVKKREEVFVDVIERLSVTFSPNGYILTCEIDGTIQMKSYLTANPEVRIALNEDLVIGQRNAPASLLYGGGGGMGEDGSGGFGIVVLDDCNFHESVRLDTFDVDRTMTLVPPDGEFSVINYRMTHEFKPPFRVYPVLEEITPFKVELFIKLKAEFPATATANSIVVRVPLPKSVIKVSCDLDPGAVGQSTDFKDASKILEWTIKKMPGGGNEHTCRAKMTLNQERGSGNMKKETGPISLSLGKDTRKQIPAGMKEQLLSHVVLKQEALEEDNKLVNEFPISIRDGVAMSLHGKVLADAYLFQGCSKAFIQFLVSRLRVEYFLPGEVVVSRHDNNHQLYLLVQGEVEEVHFSRNGARVATVWSPGEMFGEAGLLASKFSPFTAHVKSFCKVLRIDGQVFSEATAFHQEDGERIISNYLQKFGQSESEPLDFGQPRARRLTDTAEEVRRAVTQRQAQQTLSAIQQAARGDLDHLKMLRKLGADFSKGDFDGRTALHLAASRGFPDICSFILREGGSANRKALRAGHMQTAEVLREHGAQVLLDDPASELCHAVKRGMVEYLERLLSFGLDPNEADHDLRTPLHVAAAEGSVVLVRLLLEHGADAWARDRLGHLPVDEACRNGARPVIALLKDGMRVKLPPLASRPPAGRASLTRGGSQRRRHTHHQPSSSIAGAPAATTNTATTTTGTSNTSTSNTGSTPRHSRPSRQRSQSVDTYSDQIESAPDSSSSGAASPSTCLPSDPLLQQRVMHLRRRPTSSVHIPTDLLADLPASVFDEYLSEHQTASNQPLFTPPASPLAHLLLPKLHAAGSLTPPPSFDGGSELQPRSSSATFPLSEPLLPPIPHPHTTHTAHATTHAEHTVHTAPYRSASAALPPAPPAPGVSSAPRAQQRPTPLTIDPLDRSMSRSSTAPHSSLDEVRTQLIPASPEPSTPYATSQPLSGPLLRVGEPITPYPHRNYMPAGSFSGSFRALPPPPTPSVAVANRRVTVFPCRPWDTGPAGNPPGDSPGEDELSEGAHGRQPRDCLPDQAVHSSGDSASPEPGSKGGVGSRAGEEKRFMGRPYGKVVLVPLFMVTLKEQLSTLLGFPVRILVNKDGGEITDTDTIRDGDVIFAPPSEPALS
ncbi:unnamed protein product, partial [Closterium sp. NIES-64]